jgi:hypothetical protein
MRLVTETQTHLPDREKTWPLDARVAMFVLEAGLPNPANRRRRQRHHMRVAADWGVGESLSERKLYVRDVNSQYVGFITAQAIEVGTRGTIYLEGTDGVRVAVQAVVSRCRQFMEGWYEGCLEFDSPHEDFDRAA